MALKDLFTGGASAPAGPTGYGISDSQLAGTSAMGAAGNQAVGQRVAEMSQGVLDARVTSRRSAPRINGGTTKVAYNPADNTVLVNGKVMKLNGAVLRALSEMPDTELQDMDVGSIPGQFVPRDLGDIRSTFAAARQNMESSPLTLLGANAKSAGAGALTALPRALGFDVRNPYSDAEQKAYEGMNLYEQVGADESTFDSFTGFANDASRGVGSVVPAIGAAALATYATGGAALPAYLAGGATGAGSAFSSQSEQAQQELSSKMLAMPEDELRAQSPEYSAARDAGYSHEEAVEELAFNASRAAGGMAALMTLPETVLGGPVLGNIARRFGLQGALKLAGKGTALPGRGALRIPAIGAMEGAQEVAESEASQQAGARYAGFDPELGTYVNPRDFTSGMATGMVFGALAGKGGHGRTASEQADADIRNSPLGAAAEAADVGDQTAVTPDDMAPDQKPDFYAQTRELTRQVVAADAVLRNAYGENWPAQAEQIARDPDGQQLLGSYLGAMRAREAAAAQAQAAATPQLPADSGTAQGLVGPAFGDVPGQQLALPGIGAPQQAPSPEAAALGAPGGVSPQMSLLEEVGPQQVTGLVVRAAQDGDIDLLNDLMEEGAFTPEIVAAAAQQLGIPPQALTERLTQLGAGMGGPLAGQASQEPAGAPPIPNLVERRTAQGMQQQERAAASEQAPAALPPSDLATVEQKIQQLQEQIDLRTQASAAFPKTALGKRFAKEMKGLQAELTRLGAEQPRGVAPAAPEAAPLPRVATALPPEAGGELGPNGLPAGVSPPPLANPEPMSPGEAAARAQTQAERGAAAPVAPNAQAAALAAEANQTGLPGTPEPAGDIDAQITTLLDPAAGTDVVFISDGDPNIERLQADPPDGVTVIHKRGKGLFLVSDEKPEGPSKAVAIRRRKPAELNDDVMATLLQIPESKGAVLASGEKPIVVQGKKGTAVASEAVTTPSGAQATIAAIKKKAPGAKVETTTPEEAQQRRANLTPVVTPPVKSQPVKSQKDVDFEKQVDELEFAISTNDKEEIRAAKDEAETQLGETGMRKAWIAAKARIAEGEKRAKERAAEKKAIPGKAGKQSTPAASEKPQNEGMTPAAARVVGKSRENKTGKGKPNRKAPNDDERRSALDLRSKAGIEAGTLPAKRGEAVRLPENVVTVSGRNDGPLNLEVQTPNVALERELSNALEAGRLDGDSKTRAQKALDTIKQLRAMLNASIDAARDRLLKRFKAEGHDAEFGGHLADEPLSPGEVESFTQRVQHQARYELQQMKDGEWSQKGSLFRRAVGVLMPDAAANFNEEQATKSVMKAVADADPELLADLGRVHFSFIRDNLLAKQVMRGASEVNGSTLRRAVADEVEEMGHIEPIQRHVQEGDEALSHVNASPGIPDKLAKTLNGWLQLFERETSTRVQDVTLMTLDEAKQRYPGLPLNNQMGVTFPIVRFGKGRGTVIAIDTNKVSGAVAIEVMAHELGHTVSEIALRQAPAAIQRAVIDDFHAWYASQGGKTSAQVWASRAPAVAATLFKAGSGLPMDYALSFREYMADNTAKWFMTSAKPKSVVDQFFANLAKFFETIYREIAGNGAPEESVRALMDDYVTRMATNGVTEKLDPWEGLNAEDRAFLEEEIGKLDGSRSRRLAYEKRTKGAEVSEMSYIERATDGIKDLKGQLGPLVDPKTHTAARQEIVGRLNQTKAGDLWRRGVGMVTQGAQLADLYKDHAVGAPLRQVVRTRDKIGALARKLQERTNLAHEKARTLSGDAREQLNSIMKDATLWNMHPDAPFDSDKKDHPNAHLHVKNQRITDANRRRHANLKARWDRMSDTQWAARDAYVELRDSLRDLRSHTLEQQIENLTQLRAKTKTKASKAIITGKIDELQEALDSVNDGGPYFPLMRNGRYIVSAQLPSESYGKDGQTITEGGKVFTSESEANKAKSEYLARTPGARITVEPVPEESGWMLRVTPRAVYMFDTEAQARKAMPQIEKEIRAEYEYADGPNGYDRANEALKGGLIAPVKVKDNKFERSKENTDPRFWAEMDAILKENDASPRVKDAYQQLYLESLPEFSHRKSQLQRERVLGAGDDMLMAHAHRSRGAAYALADITHGAELDKAMTDLKAADDIVGRDLANSLQTGEDLARARQRRTVGNNVMNFITSANAAFSLSLAPGYAIANSAQPLAVTLPILGSMPTKDGGTVGLVKAGKYLKDAYNTVGGYFIGRGWEDFKNEISRLRGKETKGVEAGYAQQLLDKMAGDNAELRGVLEELLDRGRLDFSFLDSMDDALKGGYTMWGAIQRLGMAFPQQIEAMNRVVSAIAAYNVAKNEMGVTGDTTEMVDNLVRRTQLDYTVANRPPLFNVPGLNVILQFKMYMQGMYMLFVDAGRKMLKGATPEERREGRMALTYLMMTHGAIGGVAGLGPIGALAAMAAKGFAGDDDEMKDPDTVLRQAMQRYVGEDLGNATMRGLPTLLGVDAADKLGLPSLWDSKYMGISPRDSSAQGLDKAFLYAMGSPYANARRIWQGVNEPADKGLDALPAGMRAVARALRTGSQGLVDNDGDTFMPRDELTFKDLAVMATGFQPSKVSQAYRMRSEERSAKGRIQTRREELVQAARNGEDVKDEIAKFNANQPPVFRITAETLTRSIASKAERERGEKRRDDAAAAELVK